VGIIFIVFGLTYVVKQFKGGNTPMDLSSIEVNEEFFNSMNEKELLHYKVINSIDFFETVEGEIYNLGFPITDNGTTKYIIDIKNNRSLVHKETSNVNSDTIFNNDSSIEFYNTDKTYRRIRTSTDEIAPNGNIRVSDLNKLMPKQRYKDGDVLCRSTNLTLGVSNSILDETYLGKYMEDYDSWSIEGSEEFIGRQFTKISGKKGLVDHISKAEKYTALIDTETGIVLKYDELTSEDEAVVGFETKSIKFNEEYDFELFDLSTEGYTEKVFEKKK